MIAAIQLSSWVWDVLGLVAGVVLILILAFFLVRILVEMLP